MGKQDLLNTKTRLPGRIKIYEMPRSRSFEIDSVEDLEELSYTLGKVVKDGDVRRDTM